MVQVPVEEVALCEAFKRRLLPSLVFEEIGPGEFDFRGKVFQFSLLSYSQIIHGYLKIDRDSGIIRVVGFLYWGILAFVLSFLMMSHYTFSFMPILVLILGVLYFIQKALYDKVGKFVFEWNSHNWCK